jgi:hypothetical protein
MSAVEFGFENLNDKNVNFKNQPAKSEIEFKSFFFMNDALCCGRGF